MADAPQRCVNRKRRWIIFGSVLGLFILFLAFSVELTSSSRFCSTCHYMDPFVKSWKESPHHNVACTSCHYPPGVQGFLKSKMQGLVMVGRYWTKLYKNARPWAEISDESCLKPGCHSRRLIEGKARFKSVVFDHTQHLADLRRGKQLRCTSCHSQIVQGPHMTVTEATCFLCHFKPSAAWPQPASCTDCHDKASLVKPAQARYDHASVLERNLPCARCHTSTIVGDGAVPRENCLKCHFQTDFLNKIADTRLMHELHITEHSVACTHCHLEIQHRIVKETELVAACGECHAGTHEASTILYTGRGGKGVAKPMPDAMQVRGLSCRSCHTDKMKKIESHLSASTWTSSEKECEACHGPGYALVYKEGQAAVRGKLAALKADLARAQAEVGRSRSDSRARAQALLGEAAFNVDVVAEGRSVHNVPYSLELLSVAFMRTTQALKLAGSAFRPEAGPFRSSLVPATCAACHTGVEEVSVPAFGVVFSHRAHLENKMTCENCHSNARRHGELTATKASCAACHHQDPKADCGRCHETQKTIYGGGALGGLKVDPDAMAQAGVSCADCHLNEAKAVVRPAGAKCEACHDKTYGKMLADWESETAGLIKSLAAAIRGTNESGLGAESRQALETARQIVAALEADGSSGAHNHEFIVASLNSLIQRLKSLK